MPYRLAPPCTTLHRPAPPYPATVLTTGATDTAPCSFRLSAHCQHTGTLDAFRTVSCLRLLAPTQVGLKNRRLSGTSHTRRGSEAMPDSSTVVLLEVLWLKTHSSLSSAGFRSLGLNRRATCRTMWQHHKTNTDLVV